MAKLRGIDVRLYYFTSRQYALENIEKRRLKISLIDQLNDPFELMAMRLKEHKDRRLFRGWKKDMAAEYGLICFSENWSNPVQWSHYADRHKGACLGFDVDASTLHKVNYVRRRLDETAEQLLDANVGTEAMKRILSTKFSHWKYEQEWRLFTSLVDQENGLYFAPFSAQLTLREVIVGALSTITRTELQLAIGDIADHVSGTKARLAFKTFSVRRQHKEYLWA